MTDLTITSIVHIFPFIPGYESCESSIITVVIKSCAGGFPNGKIIAHQTFSRFAISAHAENRVVKEIVW